MRKDISDELKKLIKVLPGAIYWKDTDGFYLACSDYMLKESGFKSESEVVGKTDYDIFPKELADRLRDNDLQVIKTNTGLVAEESISLIGEEKRFFQAIKIPLKDENGVVIGILGNSIDVTDTKRAEKLHIEKCKLDIENELHKTLLKE